MENAETGNAQGERNRRHRNRHQASRGIGGGKHPAILRYRVKMVNQHAKTKSRQNTPTTSEQVVELALAKAGERNAYYFFKHRGWISRRVDRWSYVGDAQWRCDMSFDLNYDEIVNAWRENLDEELNKPPVRKAVSAVLGQADSPSCHNPVDCFKEQLANGGYFSEYLLPLFEIPKGTLFTNLDLRDGSGCAKSLVSGGACSLLLVNALVGAIEEEYPRDGENAVKSLSDCPELRGLLYEWFDDQDSAFTYDNRQRFDLAGGDETEELVKKEFSNWIERLVSDSKKGEEIVSRCGWDGVSLNKIQGDFEYFWNNAKVFRYFIKTYAVNQLYCIDVFPDNKAEQNELVKCSFESPKDLFHRRKFPLSFSPFCHFDLDVGYMTCVEEGCVTVVAPEGMIFIPDFKARHRSVGFDYDPKGNRLGFWGAIRPHRLKKQFGGVWFEIGDRMADSLKRYEGSDPAITAVGSLSKGNATMRTGKGAWETVSKVGENSGVAAAVDPVRRIPVREDELEHLFHVDLMLAPKLERRVWGIAVLLVLSVAIFLICAVKCGSVMQSPALQLLMGLVPIGTLFLATWDNAGFIRREALKLPARCAQLAIAFDAVFFMAFLLSEHDYIAWWGFGVSLVLAVVFLLWLVRAYIVQRSWQRQENQFEAFNIAWPPRR